ncbi:bifunctional diguanylate cyclase/phosphodiesterase [Methylobacter sp.]|uniref:sensor domain-containing protein n=1 Tax=Methylobacter sp. TaxID=2051955 RepID=UPI00248A63C1|nr:PAS domain S-box protein [Methylobacter sp.]MDI1279580.1 PAS domain S-box protein [Methylobacter sp.]MDI1360306.1 PAS domain S-box protein [Methylobacter sp.]
MTNQAGMNEQALHAEIARLNKVVQALINRAESSANIDTSDFNLFQSTITLEDLVRRRTDELEAALRENEKITRALRESENHNRLLVENSPMCIHEIDMGGRIVSMNTAGLCMLGLKEECEIQGYLYLDSVSTADRELVAALLTQAYAGVSSHFEFKADGPLGKIYKSCFVPINNKNGGVEKLMGITEDITERKSLEQQLVEREELFRAIFEQAPSAIELIDPETLRFVEANPAACRTLGYTHEEYLRLRLVDTQADLNEKELVAAVRQVGESGGMSFENRHRCKNGGILDVEINSRMLNLSGKRLLVGVWRNITEHKRAQEEIKLKNTILQTQQEVSPDAILVVDENAHIISYNQQFIDLWQLSPQLVSERLDAPVLQTVVEQVAEPEAFLAQVQYLYEHRDDKSHVEIQLKDGRIFDRYSAPATGADGRYYGRVWYFRDITERKRAEEDLRIIAGVFDNSQEGIVITDANNVFLNVNPAFTKITGYTREEVIGKDPKMLSSGRQQDKTYYAKMWQALKQNRTWRGEIWNRRKSGEISTELLSIAAICDDDGRVRRYVGVFSDISYLKAHEAELSQVAYYDALTGIPNRRLLADRMVQAIAQAQRSGRMLFVCYLDLGGFKQVNDRCGHEAGDQLLVEVSRRLQDALRAGDTLARLGGDEFVVLFNDLAGERECCQILDRILEIIALPIVICSHEVAVSASIGVSFHTSANEDGDTLLRQADQAMYVVKQTGKSRYHLYDAKHG